MEKPVGPNQFAMCFGSVHTSHTSSRGASSRRVNWITGSSAGTWFSFLVAAAIPFSPCLQIRQIILKPVQTVVPQLTGLFEPAVDAQHRLGLEIAEPPLGITTTRVQACTFQ